MDITENEIKACLSEIQDRRIVKPRLMRLLQYLVEATTKREDLKAAHIAGFLNPKAKEPSEQRAREEASKLRRQLKEHFEYRDRTLPAGTTYVAIVLSKPGYVLKFERRTAKPQPPAALPVQDTAVKRIWDFITGLIKKDSKDHHCRVVAFYSNEQPQLGPWQDQLGRYSGSGEVIAAHELGSTLTKYGIHHTIHPSRIETERDFSDEAKDTCYIFLGSTLANCCLLTELAASDWTSQQKFSFEDWDQGDGLKRGQIRNNARRDDEPEYYRWELGTYYDMEYAVIAVVRGPDQESNQVLVMLAGLSTLGTEAAARYITSEIGAQALIQKLKGELRPFEAVLAVPVDNMHHRPRGPKHYRIVGFNDRPFGARAAAP